MRRTACRPVQGGMDLAISPKNVHSNPNVVMAHDDMGGSKGLCRATQGPEHMAKEIAGKLAAARSATAHCTTSPHANMMDCRLAESAPPSAGGAA